MTTFTFPDVQRSSPVTVTGNTPVLNVLQPVAETSFSDTFRDPVDGVVVADQIIFDCCHLDEPGFAGIVDQWSITSPAMWIFMFKLRCIKQQTLCRPDLLILPGLLSLQTVRQMESLQSFHLFHLQTVQMADHICGQL